VRRRGLLSAGLAIDLLVVLAALSAAVGTALRQSPPPPSGPALWLEMPAIALAVLTLLGRRHFPFLAPVAIWFICVALSFVDGALVTSQPAVLVAGLGSALLLGNLRDRSRSLLGLAVGVVGAAIIVENHPHLTSELVFTPLMFAVSWLAGLALRERTMQTEAAEDRAAQAEQERESASRLAVAEERARIARELHDVVAHALSVMVLQVGVVRRRGSADDDTLEALANVEQAGRAALAEMRRLVAGMRGEGDPMELEPQPGLRDLDALLTEVRSTGLDVRLHVHGERFALPPVLDLSAYRIVQEGLTNTLKHAHARRADVELSYGSTDLVVEVRDDGSGEASTGGSNGAGHRAANGMGHGLVGIRERVTIFGGDMCAEPRGDSGRHGFVLRARLPVEGHGG
jgi:signal transduction histidine kinase